MVLSDVPWGSYVIIHKNCDTKAYVVNKELHRIGGPAMISKSLDFERYYIKGRPYTKQDYWKELYKRKLISLKKLFLKLL